MHPQFEDQFDSKSPAENKWQPDGQWRSEGLRLTETPDKTASPGDSPSRMMTEIIKPYYPKFDHRENTYTTLENGKEITKYWTGTYFRSPTSVNHSADGKTTTVQFEPTLLDRTAEVIIRRDGDRGSYTIKRAESHGRIPQFTASQWNPLVGGYDAPQGIR